MFLTMFTRDDAATELPSSQNNKLNLAIIVGHTFKDQGAVMETGMTEYQYNTSIAKKLEELVKNYPQIVLHTIYRDGVGVGGAYKKAVKLKCDAVVELHFNAFDKKAKGTVTLCTSDMQDQDFAGHLHRKITKIFNRSELTNRPTVITRSSRGAENVYAFPSGVNCILEPFFGDSEGELGVLKMDEYATVILEGALSWAKKNNIIPYLNP